MLNKGGRRLRVGIGEALDPGLAARFDGDAALTRFLRVQTYLLPSASQDRSNGAGPARAVPVADPADPVAVASAVARLHDRGVLAQSGDFIVVHAHGDEEPIVLEEIGRLRETTFRTVGEGTGRGCDLDRFDAWYEHLVLWNVRERRIAGAYRIGCVDRIVSAHGRSGLYSSTLFDYGDVFLRLLGPAIEVGRSWVHADYQRSFGPLLLLWKAIGAWVVRFPHYRSLFGAVSISGSYDPRAVQLAVAYLRRHHRDVVLTGLVRPRHPFQCAQGARLLRREIAELAAPGDLDAVMSALGGAGQGLPVLVRQYLRLGGRMLGFNVDPDFGHSIDCLVAIDLRRTEPAVLARYLGRDEAACWLARHAAHRAGTPEGRRIVTLPLRTRPPRGTSAAARVGRPDAIL
jgi:putative hemolysin